jgi:nicotinamidase-related amidase
MKKLLFRFLIPVGVIFLVVFGNQWIYNKTSARITRGVPIDQDESLNTALLIIDIQEGTTGEVSEAEGYIEQSEDLIPNLNRIIDTALARNWTVIYIGTEVVNPLTKILNNNLARGSLSAEFDKRLNIRSDLVVTKRKYDSFNRTGLDEILKEHGVGSLVVTGLDAGACVYSTIRAALNRGYRVEVIEEGVIAGNLEAKQEMIEEYRSLGARVNPMQAL